MTRNDYLKWAGGAERESLEQWYAQAALERDIALRELRRLKAEVEWPTPVAMAVGCWYASLRDKEVVGALPFNAMKGWAR